MIDMTQLRQDSRVPLPTQDVPNLGGDPIRFPLPGTPTQKTTPVPTPTAPAATQAYDPRGTFGTKLWNQWNYTGNYGLTPQSIADEWYRNSSWAPHQIWNPQYGFQDIKDIEKMYATGQDLGGLTPHMDAGAAGSKPAGHISNQQAQNAGGNAVDWGSLLDQIFGGQNVAQGVGQDAQGFTQGFTQGGTMEPTQFPYPEQWGLANDVFSQFAQGLPTDTAQWWESQQAPLERRISDQAKQMAEQMGLGGLRYSTPMTGQIADITGRETANLWGQLAEKQLGLTESAKDRGMQAAGALAGLGQQYLNAPQDWAQQMYNMGAGMTDIGQQGYDRAYQDWMRTTVEQNPWIGQLMGFMGMQNNMVPQQYQSSWLSQLLGLGGSVIPFLV